VSATATAPPTTRTHAAWAGLVVALGLMGLAMLVPAVTGWDVHVRYFPPLHAEWRPRVGWGTLPAVAIAAFAVRHAVDVSARLSWGRLLPTVYAAGLAWMLSLALVDGVGGIGDVLEQPYEYLRTARATTDLPATLQVFISRIPYDAAPDNWPVHVAGHPPGALTFFVLLVRLGLGSGLTAGLVVTLMAASTAPAVLLTMRLLGAEQSARRAAPFLVIGPAAVWQCVSADGMFAAFAAWGMCALAAGAVRRSIAWSVVAGLLLGWCGMSSYGLPLLSLLAVAVLIAARTWRPLLPAALAALAVVLAFVPFGYAWWDALPVLRERYWDGVAHNRPAAYWMWGNLAALAFSAGPMAFAGVAQTLSRWQDARQRVLTWLVLGGVAMVVVADCSQMSRAEVERIWLPFVPWLLVGCAVLPERWRRAGLAVQVVVALLLQHLLFTGW
jgi:methylthioxylose transferase